MILELELDLWFIFVFLGMILVLDTFLAIVSAIGPELPYPGGAIFRLIDYIYERG